MAVLTLSVDILTGVAELSVSDDAVDGEHLLTVSRAVDPTPTLRSIDSACNKRQYLQQYRIYIFNTSQT